MNYFLSDAADADLQDIYQFGYGAWGERQAGSYISELQSLFERLAASPGIGRHRPDLHATLQSFPHSAHQVFFTQLGSQVAFVRVLHGAADHQRQFQDYDPISALKR